MRIQNNIMAVNTHRAYTQNNDNVSKSAEKLSSGYRINRAGDDAAGLAISEKMRAQIRGLNMATKNSQDAISLVQTAEGALQETHNILQRMRELSVQSASDTNEKVIDRGALQQEFAQLQEEINDIASKTVFNDQKLIDGTFSSKLSSAETANTAAAKNANGNTVTGTFKTDGGTVSLANNVKTGVYTFGVKQVTTGKVIGSQPNKASGGPAVGIAKTDGTGVTFKIASKPDTTNNLSVTTDYTDGSAPKTAEAIDSLGNAALDEKMNGKWTVKVDQSTGEIYASNDNGMRYSGTIDETNTTTTKLIVNFQGLGQITMETATADGYKDIKNSSGVTEKTSAIEGQTFTLSGAKTTDMGETKFYASMSGADDVEIRVGDTSVTFNNGITLKLGSALTYDDIDVAQGAKQIDGIVHADDTKFGATAGKPNGSKLTGQVTVTQRNGEGLVVQTGSNEGDELKINIDKMNTSALGISLSSIGTRTNASHAITDVNNAINMVSTQRAALGALQNRLDHKIANLKVSSENLQSAESRIRDVDIASEMSTFTKNNILSQAATAMLAQANSAPQNVLSLIR